MPIQRRRNEVGVFSTCSALLDDPISNQPRVLGLARTLQGPGTRVRKSGMAVQKGVLAERNRFADFVSLWTEKAMRIPLFFFCRLLHSAFRGECFSPIGSASLFEVHSWGHRGFLCSTR